MTNLDCDTVKNLTLLPSLSLQVPYCSNKRRYFNTGHIMEIPRE